MKIPIASTSAKRRALFLLLPAALVWPMLATNLEASTPVVSPVLDAGSPSQAPPIAKFMSEAAAVVEGTVSKIELTYDENDGPRNAVTFVDVQTHRGAPIENGVVLKFFGGQVPAAGKPNGRFVYASHTPRFREGARYLLVLRAGDWFFEPSPDGFTFRVEQVAGKRVLINDAGEAVSSVSPYGVETGARLFFEAEKHEARPNPAKVAPKVLAEDTANAISPEELVQQLEALVPNELSAMSGRSFNVQPVRHWHPWNEIPVHVTKEAQP